MGEVHYMISETSKKVGVESHVLRYWEEELNLPIGRTEMGHRHYTEEDIQLFSCIKELKEQGMLLKEIKGILPDMMRAKEQLKEKRKLRLTKESPEREEIADTVKADAQEVIPEQMPEQMQSMLENVMRTLLAENNKVLEELISTGVTQKVTKDVDFLLQARSRQEEERYRKLDSLIRQQQNARKELGKVSPAYTLRKLLGDA